MGNEQIKVIIVLRGRIKGKKGEKVSESWKKISEGAVVKAEELNISLKVFSPKSYHDDDEFLLLVARAVKENPDVLIIPFTLAEKMTETLQGFSGKIVAINVPPTKEIRKNLPNFVGYVGMDQEEAGRLAAEKLLSHDRRINKFVVLKHTEYNYSHEKRIEGIKEIAEEWRIEVVEVYVGAENQEIGGLKKILDNETGVITLGIRGTEAALKAVQETKLSVPIVGMDLNKKIADAIRYGEVLAIIDQHLREQGTEAIELSVRAVKGNNKPAVVMQRNLNLFCDQ